MARWGRSSAPRRPAVSGMKRTIDRWMVTGSRARDQEVESHAADPYQQQQRVAAQVAGLYRAREGAAHAHDPGGAADDRALHEVGLDHVAAEAPHRRHGPGD